MCGTIGARRPFDGAGPLAHPGGLDAVLDAALEQDLHADADPQDRSATGQSPPDDPIPADGEQSGHARRVRPDARYHQSVGVQRRIEVGRHGHLGPDPLQRAGGGRQVAGAVVQHHDGTHRRDHTSHNNDPARQPAANTPNATAVPRWSVRHIDTTPPARNPASASSSRPTHIYSTPFVEGTPRTRGSDSTAARNARATP